MKKFLIIFFVVLVQVCAGQQSITWQRVYEGPYNGDDGFHGIVGDNFGNSYLLGYVRLQTTTGFFVVKIDSHGDTIWTKNIGGYGNGQGAYSGSTTIDGSIVFTGDRDTAFSICLSANGNIVWNKTYPNPNLRFAVLSDMIKTSDNGYIMCGKVFTLTHGVIIKIDSSGNLQWFKRHSAPFQKRYNKIIEIEGGYLIDGEADISKGNTYTVLLKINNDGEIIWERQYRLFTYGFYPSTMFYINTSYWIFGSRNTGLAFVKFDTSGMIKDSVSIHSSINKYDSFRDAVKINNNKFVITSLREGPSGADTTYAEAKIIDSLGIVYNSKLFLGYEYTQLTSCKKETNGDLTFAGLMYYWQRGTNSNGYAVRTDSNLNYPPVSINNNEKIIKKDYALYQNYPNPFNPETMISFEVPERSKVKILIYNSKGDLVYSLINSYYNAGKYNIRWNGTSFSTGIYFVNLLVNGKPIKSLKAILLK